LLGNRYEGRGGVDRYCKGAVGRCHISVGEPVTDVKSHGGADPQEGGVKTHTEAAPIT
jgi:hypothetical protein